jgi:hypothetical protein
VGLLVVLGVGGGGTWAAEVGEGVLHLTLISDVPFVVAGGLL